MYVCTCVQKSFFNFVGKLVVVEAWDEPTSSNPHGKHGDVSLYYEGKAAQVALTYSNSTSSVPPFVIKNAEDSMRLEQMAICSGFQYVSKLKSDSGLEVAVGEKRTPVAEGRRMGKMKKVSLSREANAEKEAMIKAMKRLGL